MAGKNENGAGSIRQRANGSWEGRYSDGFDPATGKQVQRSIYGKTKKEVRQRLNKILTEIANHTYTQPSKMTVSAWLNTWLKDYTENVKPFTKKAYDDRIRLHIIPAIGAIKLSALTPPMVQSFINNLSREPKLLAPKTVKNIHGVLHRALAQAVIIGYLPTNPASHCVLPRMVKPEIKVLANDDLKTFIEAASKNKYKNIFLIDLFTGLRQSEILGLTWPCIDWENSQIIVKAQLQREKKAGGQYYLTTLKNDKTRTICVAPTVMELLRQRKEFQEWERIAAHTAWFEDIPGLVFETPTGKHLSHTTVRNNFKKVVTEIGMSEVRFHDLRHSFAVACLQNGDDVKTVQGNLGHYTSSFTLDTYGHVTQKMETESAQRMEQYIQTYAPNR